MKVNSLLVASLATLGLVACQEQPNTVNISGVVSADAELNGSYVYLYTAGQEEMELRDSALIQNNKFAFAPYKEVDIERSAELKIGRSYRTPFILEAGAVFVDMEAEFGSGTPLNDQASAFSREGEAEFNAFTARYDSIQSTLAPEVLHQEETPAELATVQREFAEWYRTTLRKGLEANGNNAFGASLLGDVISGFVSGLFDLSNEDLETYISLVSPSVLDKSPKLKRQIATLKAASERAVGKSYADIEGTNEHGETVALSQYIPQSKLTILDFWASWCGPCRRAMPELQAIQKAYSDKGVQIVGIAVWDEIENIRTAQEELGITWPQIYSKDQATGLYGVMSIPQIMVINSEGIIVARDLRGEEAIKAVLDRELAK